MFEDLDRYMSEIGRRTHSTEENVKYLVERIRNVEGGISNISWALWFAFFGVVCFLVGFGCMINKFEKAIKCQCPCDVLPCCEVCTCPLMLLDPLSEVEEQKLFQDENFVKKLLVVAPPSQALDQPRISKLNRKAVSKGTKFEVDFGGGIGRIGFSTYTTNPQEKTDVVRYKNADVFDVSIDHDCIHGYFDVGSPDFVVRVDTVVGDLVALYPVKKPKKD